jgi:acetate kinase
MSEVILTVNAGSSSVKFAAFARHGTGRATAAPERLLHGRIEGIGAGARLIAWQHDDTPLEGDTAALPADALQGTGSAFRLLFEWLERHVPDRSVVAVAHRVVHGGAQFAAPVLVNPGVLVQLDALVPLAPLHQPHNLAAIRAIAGLAPALPQVACFDTAFHAGQPWVMQAYALPRQVRDAGVRRYGFHGLSYEYIAGVLPGHLGAAAEGRVVVGHLGNGASLCALHRRRSVATTMGFTALDGLMMGTRCGSLDPGVVLYLMAEMKMGLHEVETLLYQESGLLGVSGISSDMRTLEASADPRAAQAIDLYVNRISREIGGLAAMLGGLDALVFTAGIGEHSAAIRRRVCESAAWLGVGIDEEANRAGACCISVPGSRVSAWAIPTDEERMLAEHAQRLLAGSDAA